MQTVTLQITVSSLSESFLNALQHELAAIDVTLDNANELWEQSAEQYYAQQAEEHYTCNVCKADCTCHMEVDY